MNSRSPRSDPVEDRQYVSPLITPLPVGGPKTTWDTLHTEAGAEGYSDWEVKDAGDAG